MKPNSCACYGSNDIHECYCNLKNNNMEKETLEEVAERLYSEDIMWGMDLNKDTKNAFIEGAKWQKERSYSEEDMLKSFMAGIKCEEDMVQSFMSGIECESNNGKNFEQFIKQINYENKKQSPKFRV